MFDILEELHTLPDLVTDTVLLFLPLAFIKLLTHSTRPELCRLARRREWRRICVGIFYEDSVNIDEIFDYEYYQFTHGRYYDDPYSSHHPITHHEFNEMVQTGTPPPFHIHRLQYSTWSALTDLLFMTPAWRAYVTTHVDSLALEIHDGDNSSARLASALPYLNELNVVDICFTNKSVSGTELHVDDLILPRCLTALSLFNNDWTEEDLQALVIPPSVVHLELEVLQPIHPTQLPVLPPRLQVLKTKVPEHLDVSDCVHVFPPCLQELGLDVDNHPPMISASALQHFSPLLKHSLMVYHDGASLLDFPGVRLRNQVYLGIDLNRPGDYASLVSLPCRRVEAYRGMTGDQTQQVTLPQLAHLFPQLEQLDILSDISLQNVLFPPTLGVEAFLSDSLPPEALCAHRITRLCTDMSISPRRLRLLGQLTHLTSLHLDLSDRQKHATITSPPNLRRLMVVLSETCDLPNFWLFKLVQQFKIKYHTPKLKFNPKLLPPNIWLLQLQVDVLVAHRANLSKHQPFTQRISLRHLQHLTHLEFCGISRLHLGKVVFPSSLVAVECLSASHIRLDGVRFPDRLQRLTMSDCCLKNPWTTGGRRPVVYPESLRVLDVSGNHGITPPPPEFLFPLRLHHLNLNDCAIADVSLFRFPQSLRCLDVDQNDFVIPENHAWPPLQQLKIKQWMDDGLLTQPEYQRLRSQIPGVRINL